MIPDFQSIMLPILKSFKEGEIKSSKELRLDMVNYFNITAEEQKDKIPSGKQFVYYNRIAWAISYLKMAELIYSPKRGSYHITNEGANVSTSLIFTPILFNPGQPKPIYRPPSPHGPKTTKHHLYSKNRIKI